MGNQNTKRQIRNRNRKISSNDAFVSGDEWGGKGGLSRIPPTGPMKTEKEINEEQRRKKEMEERARKLANDPNIWPTVTGINNNNQKSTPNDENSINKQEGDIKGKNMETHDIASVIRTEPRDIHDAKSDTADEPGGVDVGLDTHEDLPKPDTDNLEEADPTNPEDK